jgi:hypothetical protein
MKDLALGIIMLSIFVSCQSPQNQSPEPEPVDIAAVSQEVSQWMDLFNQSWNSKDANSIAGMLSDGIYCGTDPSEIMDKVTMVGAITEMLADSTQDLSLESISREIVVSPEGNSAIIMEQVNTKWAPNIPIRSVSGVIKTSDGWRLNFASWSFMLNNDDVAAVNELVASDIQD